MSRRKRQVIHNRPVFILGVALSKLRPGKSYNLAFELLSKVKLLDDKGCWIIRPDWSEYATFNEDRAHRVSYDLFVGNLIYGLYVCHKCDRKGCINPDHLFQDTCSENNRDARRKATRARIDQRANILFSYGHGKDAIKLVHHVEDWIKNTGLDKRINKC